MTKCNCKLFMKIRYGRNDYDTSVNTTTSCTKFFVNGFESIVEFPQRHQIVFLKAPGFRIAPSVSAMSSLLESGTDSAWREGIVTRLETRLKLP